ncbi:M6 family metalloprotease domain-containing protein [Elongatibacter sediminis]|uniref:M6 family metalloprotease domain-containing protein n=1 Tax=Elongatibacter sediminis TaxID=3119006 RepID=A0AAW9RK10_9GAMM
MCRHAVYPARSSVRAAFFSLIFLTAAFSQAVLAMPANPRPIHETQPDGTQITVYLRGDEHYNWTEDANGFTVLREKGWFEFAERGPDGRLRPTGLKVGHDNPAAAGLERSIKASAAVRAAGAKGPAASGSSGSGSAAQGVAPAGNVKNLVVMVRFADHVGRTLPTAADMDVLFNAVGGDATLAPTGSVRDVYYENSYGQMTLVSDINPGIGDWITVSQTEAYYANGNSGDSTLWQALREALDQLDAVIDFNDYDLDNNGRIDSIAFIHSGYAAEWGGTDAYGTHYSDRIWSHRWAIQPQWNSNDGVSVFDYHISPGVWGTSGSNIGRIGVIAHETGHFFGLPDLYDIDSSGGEGIGSWGLMANSWDFNFTQLCPPHFSPWSKVDLGWYTPTVLSQPGQYAINQAETHPEAYRIDSGYPSGEYLLIENRQNAGFDCTIPQGGLVIWHIDDTADYDIEGYPGQSGWPGNGNHYRVAVLQADGDYDLERGNNRGDSGDVHHAGGVDAIGPGPGGDPNTDAYKNGNIIVTGHVISDVSASGSSMTFCLNGCSGIPAPTGLSATAQGTSAIALAWSDNSTDEDGFTIERSSDGSSWSTLATTAANTTAYNDSGLGAASTWYYRVQAFNATETSSWSNTASATTDDVPPAAPTNLQASAVSDSAIDLTWVDQAGNEDDYRLERSDDGSTGWSLLANLGANSTAYSDTGLNASEDYFYRVRAGNAFGDSAWSNTASATTDDPPPYTDHVAQSQNTSEGSVSGGLSATHNDDGSAQQITETQSKGNPSKRRSSLATRYTFTIPAGNSATLFANAWSGGSSDNDEFEFRFSTDGSSFSPVFTVSSTSSGNLQSAALPGNPSGTVYVEVIDTDNGQGNSQTDTVNIDHLYIRVDNQPTSPPADPSGLSANAVAYNQVDIAWTDNANDETGYEVERAVGGGGFSLLITLGANATSYSDTSVSELTTYTYRVRALKGATASGYSNTAQATTPEQPVTVPADPTNLSANAAAHNQVDLSWTDNASDETGYEVERAVGGGGFSLLTTLGANATSYSDTSVSELTTYTYRVRAFNGANASGYSNTAQATTPEEPSGSITLSANGYKVKGRHNVDLSWSGAAGGSVDIYRDGSLLTTTANDGAYHDNIGARGGATYDYQVCEAGSSTCSGTATVVF